MKHFKAALCTATAAGALIAAPVSAQRVNNIVAFGDSYADDGNFFELTGIPRPAAYPNGRFSNGTNFVDTMGLLLNRPIRNYAIGGAFAGSGNINGIGGGFQLQYQSWQAGGGPAAFPRSSGQFDPNDLIVISIGGNDARAYRLGGGTAAGAAAAAAPRIAEATTGLNALVTGGARNITFLAGDVGRLPEAIGQPSAAAGSAYSAAFNQGMQNTLATYANQGVIVNYLDVNRIGDRVIANPGAFGLASAGASTGADVAAGNADRFLFYADNVHLSSAGFAIVGRYAVRQLEAPLHLAAQTDVGLLTANAFGSTLAGRLDLADARFGEASQGLRAYLVGNTARLDRAATLRSLGYEMDTFGLTGGLEYTSGGLVVGGAVNVARGEADMETGTGRAKVRAVQGGLYAGWSGQGFFVQGQASYGRLRYTIIRDAVIDQLFARPDGDAITAGAQAGYLFDLGGLRIGPVIGLRYADVDLDGYTEQGDAALTLNVVDQGYASLIGNAGFEARTQLDVGGLAVRPYASASIEREFDGDARTIRYALTAAPGIVNQWQLPARSDDIYGRITGGVNLNLTDSIALQLQASTSISQDEGNDASGLLAVRVGF